MPISIGDTYPEWLQSPGHEQISPERTVQSLCGPKSVKMRSRSLRDCLSQHPYYTLQIWREFFLWTDASERGFGAVLEQEDDEGRRHPIAYASRATNSAEQKYAPTELEFAALVFALDYF